jgi:hypothetical protein
MEQQLGDTGSATVRGSRGSAWSTPERRRAKGWAEVGEPTDSLPLTPTQPKRFEATIAATPSHHGEQAGVYAYASAASWVKLVLEGAGDGKGVFLALAEQHDGNPTLRGKLSLPHFSGTVSLRLVQGAKGTVRGFWRTGADTPWAAVTRGLGWLDPAELGEGAQPGSLDVGDPRCEATAECTLPDGWRAVLLTEQWQGQSDVTFSDMASCSEPAPTPEPEPAPVIAAEPAPEHPGAANGDPCACCSVGLPMSYQTGERACPCVWRHPFPEGISCG